MPSDEEACSKRPHPSVHRKIPAEPHSCSVRVGNKLFHSRMESLRAHVSVASLFLLALNDIRKNKSKFSLLTDCLPTNPALVLNLTTIPVFKVSFKRNPRSHPTLVREQRISFLHQKNYKTKMNIFSKCERSTPPPSLIRRTNQINSLKVASQRFLTSET